MWVGAVSCLQPLLFDAVFLADLRETRSACRFSHNQDWYGGGLKEHWNAAFDTPRKSLHN